MKLFDSKGALVLVIIFVTAVVCYSRVLDDKERKQRAKTRKFGFFLDNRRFSM